LKVKSNRDESKVKIGQSDWRSIWVSPSQVTWWVGPNQKLRGVA